MNSNDSCFLWKGPLNRWVIVKADDLTLAWSGSRWVPHSNGFPASSVQVSNFGTLNEARLQAEERGFDVRGFVTKP